ncbi:MAG TPA: thioredoxin TrxA [Buchnera sp. (in: enterobacteria)]|nr:thioredoxin TrxA [Buchnera sp. (in: enterobacteria)]
MNNINIINVNDENFEKKILKEKNFILVDFWAEWCNPCKILAPILEKIASEYKDRLIIAKMNIDENPNTAPKYAIRGIPALLLFKNGSLLKTKIGTLSLVQLKKFLDENLK